MKKTGKQLLIKNIYIGSHGGYDEPYFYLGNDVIDSKSVAELKIFDWERTEVPIFNFIIMACHTGGGRDVENSKNFLIDVAKNLKTFASVLESASWVGNVFDNSQEIVHPTICSEYTEKVINEFINRTLQFIMLGCIERYLIIFFRKNITTSYKLNFHKNKWNLGL